MSLLEESRIIIPMQKMSHTNNLDLINIYAEYIMQNARLNEAQAEIQIAGRNINNLRDADDTILIAENKKKLRAS